MQGIVQKCRCCGELFVTDADDRLCPFCAEAMEVGRLQRAIRAASPRSAG